MLHPDLHALLCNIAQNAQDQNALAILGDWLEEHGDPRAAALGRLWIGMDERGRGWTTWEGSSDRKTRPYLFPSEKAAQEDLSCRVLRLFPDGPRWRVERRAASGRRWYKLKPRFLTPAAAARYASFMDEYRIRTSRITGPK